LGLRPSASWWRAAADRDVAAPSCLCGPNDNGWDEQKQKVVKGKK